MDAFQKMCRLWVKMAGAVGVAGVLLMMVHISLDVMARNLLGSPLVGTNEIVSRYYMLVVAFAPLALVEYAKGMISVAIFDEVLPAPIVRLSDMIVSVVSIGVFGLLTWTTGLDAVDAFSTNAFVMAVGVRIPVWPTYFILPLGCSFGALTVVFRLFLQMRGQDPGSDLDNRAAK